MARPFPEKLTTLPHVPKEFGGDGGHFYKYYDELADELDEDLVARLKSQLDGILIFAGLFAGINSAFLAFTLPQMSADPASDTNALLLQIALGAANGTIASAADLPSASFTPPPGILSINILFSVSLTLALFVSFLAVLGQQWLVYYRKRDGGGPESQRWEQLRRYIGAKRWRLEIILNDLLPTLLQAGLVVFCIAFVRYLGTLSRSISYPVLVLLYIGLAIILATAACAAWDPWCPFKSPTSHLIHNVWSPLVKSAGWIVGIVFQLSVALWCGARPRFHPARYFLEYYRRTGTPLPAPQTPQEERERWMDSVCDAIKRWFALVVNRAPDDEENLQAIAVKRVVCTSEDRTALVYAAVNLQTLNNGAKLRHLTKDQDFRARLFRLCQPVMIGDVDEKNGSWIQQIEARAFSSSLSHLFLAGGSYFDFFPEGRGLIVPIGAEVFIFGHHVLDGFGRLARATRIPCPTQCTRCLRCTMISFYMGLGDVLRSSYVGPRKVDFTGEVFGDVKEALSTYGPELRLSYMVASWITCSGELSRLTGERRLNYADTPHIEEVQNFLGTYRTTANAKMVQHISEALGTLGQHWEDQPDPELYVLLFEHALSSIRDQIQRSEGQPNLLHNKNQDDVLLYRDQAPILIKLGVILRFLEQRWRADAIPGNGEYQDRCIRSAKESLERCTAAELARLWNEMEPSLRSYLGLIKEKAETTSGNTENPNKTTGLRLIFSVFPEPGGEKLIQELLPQELEAYSGSYFAFRDLLDRVESTIRPRNELILEPGETIKRDKEDVAIPSEDTLKRF
ncbi:hypothetical protein FRC00_004263 [Tulasnella sp. 408]|nr:hypothetical protein FRC00_004263 [Tulasnella sp. 408]